MSFFGGDHSKSHWSASPHYRLPGEDSEAKRRDRSKLQYAALKAAGWKTRYFQYPNGNVKAKAEAKRRCKAWVKEWERKVGFKLEMHEGCFL